MIMEYNLGKHNYCWSCGCEIIDIEINYTESGYEKYYYTCTSCNEFWVKSHCGYRGHKLIKHYNNYHRQPKDYSWFLVCPTCRDGEPN